eukprot:g32742.t1
MTTGCGIAGRIRVFLILKVACGCKATSNRAHVRRAVFHTTQMIEWKDLIETQLKNDLTSIESVARMPCPVTLPDRTMLTVKVNECAPKRIIYAGKAATLRAEGKLALAPSEGSNPQSPQTRRSEEEIQDFQPETEAEKQKREAKERGDALKEWGGKASLCTLLSQLGMSAPGAGVG